VETRENAGHSENSAKSSTEKIPYVKEGNHLPKVNSQFQGKDKNSTTTDTSKLTSRKTN
jgi:hypothetical protein